MSVPHAEWVEEITTKPLFITVGDMQQHGMFIKTTTFGISSGATEAASDATVRRRYSDFDWLYKLLCHRYQAIVVPKLPPKGVVTNFEKRIQGLNRFMSRCLRSPFLKGDPSFAHFLSSAYNASSKWDTLKNTATSQSALPFLVRPVIDQYRTYGTELASGDGAGEDEK